jgi:DnaK suppressor protein
MDHASPRPDTDVVIARLRTLRRQAEEAIESLQERDQPVELDQTVQGRVSRIDAIAQQQMARASKTRLLAELQRIDAAIARAERGVFGTCCRCAMAIEPRRLEADPTVALCMDCLEEIAEEQDPRHRGR